MEHYRAFESMPDASLWPKIPEYLFSNKVLVPSCPLACDVEQIKRECRRYLIKKYLPEFGSGVIGGAAYFRHPQEMRVIELSIEKQIGESRPNRQSPFDLLL